jgi:hypothetical protein
MKDENRRFEIGLRLDQNVMNIFAIGGLQHDVFLIHRSCVVRSFVNRKKRTIKRTPAHQT